MIKGANSSKEPKADIGQKRLKEFHDCFENDWQVSPWCQVHAAQNIPTRSCHCVAKFVKTAPLLRWMLHRDTAGGLTNAEHLLAHIKPVPLEFFDDQLIFRKVEHEDERSLRVL